MLKLKLCFGLRQPAFDMGVRLVGADTMEGACRANLQMHRCVTPSERLKQLARQEEVR